MQGGSSGTKGVGGGGGGFNHTHLRLDPIEGTSGGNIAANFVNSNIEQQQLIGRNGHIAASMQF